MISELHQTTLTRIDDRIREYRTRRKFFRRPDIINFICQHRAISDTEGNIYITLVDQPGFTLEQNPELATLLDNIHEWLEKTFGNVRAKTISNLPDQREYIFSLKWHSVAFRVHIWCYLTRNQ